MDKQIQEWIFQYRLAERAIQGIDSEKQPERHALLKQRMEEAELQLTERGTETIRFMGKQLLRYAAALHETFEHRDSPEEIRRIVEQAFSREEA
ncbi:hypothetical protein ACFPVX_16155 [Cohnella faecalis]|nr:hypothetical protein [Cohnella faecalis]